MISKLLSLKTHPGFMKYFKNTSWLFAEKILRMVVGLFVSVWVARYLGPEQFGLFSYAASFVGLFTAISALGLDGIVVRELVKDESRRNVLLGTALRLKQAGALMVLSVLGIAVQFTSNDAYTNALIFIIAGMILFQVFNVVDFFFQSRVLSRYVVYVNTGSLFISSLVKITLILINAPLIAFALAVLFDSIIVALGLLYFYTRIGLSYREWIFDKGTAFELLKESWPLMFSGIVISVYMKIDQVMIKEMLDSEAVGQYAVAVRLSEVWYFIPVVITNSLFPAIINAKKTSETLYYKRLQNLYNLMVWMALAIAVPMTFLGHWITSFLYGVQYHEAGNVLVIHIWAAVFVFLSVASGKWYINEGLAHLAFYRNLFGAVMNVGLNLLLIPRVGIVGAAVATIISYACAAYLFDILHVKTRKLFIQKTHALLLINIFPKKRTQ